MLGVIIRTLIIYFSLLFFMKLMGKRQVGELEISELVSTLLLSEIVSMPIENADIPIASALVPMLIIISLEIILSFSITKSDLLKRLLSGKPSVLIKRGVVDISELQKSRMSVEELMSELRLKGIGEIDDVYYAMLEQNGQISAILKKSRSPVCCKDISIEAQDPGISHPIIVDGHIKKSVLQSIGRNESWLNSKLKENGLCIGEVFLMTVNDSYNITIIKKGRE